MPAKPLTPSLEGALHIPGEKPRDEEIDVLPAMTAITSRWGDVLMACSDGLTKHVTEDRIQERLRTLTSAEQVCRQLVDHALEGGGSDNIAVLVGYARKRPVPAA